MDDWARRMVEWHDLYAFIGTAASTLMGLTFVVITLSPRTVVEREDAVKAFTTPIMAFFGTIVVLAVVMLVPRLAPLETGIAFAIVGLIGIGYMYSTGTYRIWRDSELGVDDLVWYVILPSVGYLALVAVAVEMWRSDPVALYVAGGTVLLFLIVGIRNAWDVVLEVARQSSKRKEAEARAAAAAAPKPPQP